MDDDDKKISSTSVVESQQQDNNNSEIVDDVVENASGKSQSNIIATGLINSTNDMHDESFIGKNHPILPSYSTVLKLEPSTSTYPSLSFIPRQPPPSYSEVHGEFLMERVSSSTDSVTLGPNPLYVTCPRCRTLVVSDIHAERSNLAYIVSVLLCVCLCWPCCLIPLCLKSCRNTYHFCPICRFYLGSYRPC